MTWVKPPVSAGFSDEVGLIEDVDMLVWMLRLPVLVVESQKAESVVSAGERNQTHQISQ